MFSWLTGEKHSSVLSGITPGALQENSYLYGLLMLVWVFFFSGLFITRSFARVSASTDPVSFSLATLNLDKFRKPGWAPHRGLEQAAWRSQLEKAGTRSYAWVPFLSYSLLSWSCWKNKHPCDNMGMHNENVLAFSRS